MSHPLATAKHDAKQGHGAPKQAAGGDKTVKVAGTHKQMPFVREKKGFAAQHERITERGPKQGEKKEEGEEGLPGAPNAASTSLPIEQAEVAEGEEKGVDVAAAFKEFVESWHEKSEKGEGGGDAKADGGDGKAEPKDEEPGTHTVEHDHDGWHEKTSTTEHTASGHDANLGDFASPKELFTVASMVKYSDEERERTHRKGKTNTSQSTAGVQGSAKAEIKSRKGNVRQEASAEAKGLAGAQAAAKTLLVADDTELTAAVTFLARAGAFGQAGAKYNVRQGRAALGAWAKTSGGAGVQARGRAVAQVDLNPLVPAVVAFFEGAVQAGVWGDIEAGFRASYGRLVATVVSKASFFAGAQADAKAGGYMNATEIALAVQASAMAGAKGTASLSETIAIEGIGELEFTQGVMAFAGAQAKAAASGTIGLTGIAVKAKASAFAGAKASVFGTAAFKARGREIVKVSGKIGVAVGAGAEVGGEFSFQSGKLVIGGDLAAVLKGGVDMGGKFEIDFDALAVAIMQTVADQFNKQYTKIDMKGADFDRKTVKNHEENEERQKRGYEAVIDLFDDHAVKVMGKVDKGKLTGYCLNPTDLQKIVQKGVHAAGLTNDYTEYDRGIELAANDAFGELLKGTPGVVIDALRVTGVQSLTASEAAEASRKYKVGAAQQKASQKLKAALDNYAGKKQREPATAAHRYTIQAIIDDNWKAMDAAYPNGLAGPQVVQLVQASLGAFLLNKDDEIEFDVGANGQITEIADIDSRIVAGGEQRAKTAKGAQDSKIHDANEVMEGRLKAYLAELSSPKKTKAASGEKVQKIVNKAASDLKSELAGDRKAEVRASLLASITKALGNTVQAPAFDGETTKLKDLTWNDAELKKSREDAADAKTKTERTKLITKLNQIVERRMARAKKEKNKVELKYSIIHAIDDPLTKTARKVAALDGKKGPDDALDTELAAGINAALNGLFTVTVTKGSLDMKTWYSDPSEAVYQEEQRKGNAKIKGGEEDDNARRKLLADAVREPFRSYANKIREEIDNEVLVAGTSKVKPVDRRKLQDIIDKRTSSIRADIETDVGDEAVKYAVATYFGIKDDPASTTNVPLLKAFRVQKLKIQDDFKAADVTQIVSDKRGDRTRKTQEANAVAQLVTELKQLPGRKRRSWITKAELNKAIDNVPMNALSDESKEFVIRSALSKQFPNKVKDLDVDQGKVTTIAFASSTGR